MIKTKVNANEKMFAATIFFCFSVCPNAKSRHLWILFSCHRVSFYLTSNSRFNDEVITYHFIYNQYLTFHAIELLNYIIEDKVCEMYEPVE